jgi:hypothetical protein
MAPLRARRQVLGAVTLGRSTGRAPLTSSDLAMVEDLAHRVALGVDNARLYQETQHVAERLQRSLLPALPETGPLRLAARYAPAAATIEVGGDWYDSFPLPSGHTTLIIGDVTGHDLRAAITMSQLRGIACDRQEPPGGILRRLDGPPLPVPAGVRHLPVRPSRRARRRQVEAGLLQRRTPPAVADHP